MQMHIYFQGGNIEINNIDERSFDLDENLRNKISFYYRDITFKSRRNC